MKLNRERLVSAALALLDDEGIEALSMRNLATRVDRQVSSLYNHVSGRSELVELIRARVVADIDVRAFTTEDESVSDWAWDDALEAWARSYLRAFAAHPNLIRLLATTEIRDDSTYAMYDAVVAGLRRGGWSDGRTVAVMRTVEAHVLGSALDIVAPEGLITQDSAGLRFPAVRVGLDARFAETSSAIAAFDLGLRALIDGLRLQMVPES